MSRQFTFRAVSHTWYVQEANQSRCNVSMHKTGEKAPSRAVMFLSKTGEASAVLFCSIKLALPTQVIGMVRHSSRRAASA